MKRFIIVFPLLIAGCQYHPAMFPLERGDSIVFGNGTRAAQFRSASGNDQYAARTNRVVRIDRPTSVQCE